MVVQWLGLGTSLIGYAGSILVLGTKIPHAIKHSQNKPKINKS